MSHLPIAEASRRAIVALDLHDSSKTTYSYALRAFAEFLGDGATADDVTNQTLYDYRLWLRDVRGHPSRTIANYVAAAKHLLRWLDLQECLPPGVSYYRIAQILTGTAGRRRESYQRRHIDPEIHRLLEYFPSLPLPAAGPTRLILLRNRALVQTLYDTGMRISEALALTRADVMDGRAVKVRLTVTKNSKPRTVYLAQSRALIAMYCGERADSRKAPLFVSHGRAGGSALTPASAQFIIKRAAAALGLSEETSPHSLRHARAQDLLDGGMPIEWVAALLGHGNINTTRVIYAWETDEDRLQAMVARYG